MFTGYSTASNVILRASANSKMLANSYFLLFAALFDLHMLLTINVLGSTVPREHVHKRFFLNTLSLLHIGEFYVFCCDYRPISAAS